MNLPQAKHHRVARPRADLSPSLDQFPTLNIERDSHMASTPYAPQAILPPSPNRVIGQLNPYEATSSRDLIEEKPEQIPLKLDWNESTQRPSPRVKRAIISYLEGENHLNWYSHLNSENLIAPLSEHYALPSTQILVTNGSDEGLHMLCATYLEMGDRVVYAAPTYQHFLVFAQQEGAQLEPYFNRDPFTSEIEGIIDRVLEAPTKICYLVSPNNPTGVIYCAKDIARFLESAPETLVIIDEAYAEFSEQTCAELLYTYSNLVITRTFSKAYGLAGSRVGYLMAHPIVIRDLKRIFNPKSVNALAQIAAIEALDDQPYLKAFVDEVRLAQMMCIQALEERGIKARSTPANFFMLRSPHPDLLVDALVEEDVYVRNRDHLPGLKGYIRVSVGTRDQMIEFIRRLDLALERLEIT
jgi:histidinol-phosphate aminotransferase